MQAVATEGRLGRRLRAVLPPFVAAVLTRLRRHGGRPVVVGGAVRSAVLGVAPADWDVAVDLPAARVATLFPRVLRHGEAHGTVMVLTGGGAVEVTSFPASAIEWGARLLADLQRRDFTCNAMAWDPAAATVYDPFKGAADLRRGILRAVVDPAARFAEDPLRALRAARFVAQLQLRPQTSTARAMAATAAALGGVAFARQGHEMRQLLAGPAALAGLQLLARQGLLAQVAPGLLLGRGLRPLLERLPPDPWLRLVGCLWLAGAEPPCIEALLQRWCASKGDVRLAAAWLRGVRELRAAPPTAAALRQWAAGVGRAAAPGCWTLAAARWPRAYAPRRAALRRLLQRGCLTLEQLALDGEAVRALGAVGPRIGAILANLLEQVLRDPRINRKASLTRLATEMLRMP